MGTLLAFLSVSAAAANAAEVDHGYLKMKWRRDCSDPSTGISAKPMARELESIVAERMDREPWAVVKAMLFSNILDRVAIDVDGRDWFPAFSPWAYHGNHPLKKILRDRDAAVSRARIPAETAAIEKGNRDGRWNSWKDFCHSVPDWEETLRIGFPGMRERLRANAKDTPFYRALAMTSDAVFALLGRLTGQGERRLAGEEDPVRRRRIAAQVASIRALRERAPRTAYEALQFIYLNWVVSENADMFQVRSLGNLDRTLAPYYRADVLAGRTTEADFREQLTAFWWQWGSIDNYWGQPAYLGGTRADGSTEYNEVSRIILDVHDELALPTPKLQLKMGRSTPDWVWEKSLDMARRHRSLVFCGEEPMSAVMKSQGHTDEECRLLEIRGCFEFQARGLESRTSVGHVNLLKPVEELLSQANSGAFEAASWQAFYSAYLARMTNTVAVCRELNATNETLLGEINCGNMFSWSVGSSVESGRDAFVDGMAYNNTGLLQVGLGTAVDALLAVKELVYENHEFTLAELGGVMACDWKGHEGLRLRMLRSKRKWGNNDPEANAIARAIGKAYAAELNFKPNTRGGVFMGNGHCAKQFVVLGERTGATPDGRHAGDEMSKNLSPTMGADTEGVTALLESFSHLDPTDFPGDVPLDVMLLPSSVAGDKGLCAMRRVVEMFFRNGGCAIHFNVVDVGELRDAQAHPGKYENLQVRVCGWNVRWNDLPRREQEAYIRRAEEIAR